MKIVKYSTSVKEIEVVGNSFEGIPDVELNGCPVILIDDKGRWYHLSRFTIEDNRFRLACAGMQECMKKIIYERENNVKRESYSKF